MERFPVCREARVTAARRRREALRWRARSPAGARWRCGRTARGRRQEYRAGARALRFALYGRVSTEDWHDRRPRGPGSGSRPSPWSAGAGASRRSSSTLGRAGRGVGAAPQAAALVAALADPDRGWDAIVIGEYERAFCGAQYALMAPLFEHYGVQLWMPEAGGRVDYASEHDEQAMTCWACRRSERSPAPASGSAPRWPSRPGSRAATSAGARRTGTGSADAGPHPNKAHASWGRRAHRLEPDPETAHVARWIFAQRLAGHSVARIARALNDAGIRARRPQTRSGTRTAVGRRVDAADGRHDPGQPAVHRAAGVEPAAHRQGPGRPGRRQPGAQERAAVEPARRVGHLQHGPRTRRWSARPTSSPPRTSAPPAAPRPGRPGCAGRAGTCWPGSWSAGRAGGGWNQRGPTASPPTGAATGTPALPRQTRAGRRTPTSARIASCRSCPRCICC